MAGTLTAEILLVLLERDPRYLMDRLEAHTRLDQGQELRYTIQGAERYATE